ncbi:type IV secretory system conjugative DNA transfer family protein [Modicisalibacter coralii]|uniref:type IV secretory system conjugative DNA transfer family protein n=1 Tax=Modicisalibacter coralii TaxID=2304602 RepID=UPI00100A8831|nr:type IV secretory system conjugative DNA transfer family protein [Halomonas coralii]
MDERENSWHQEGQKAGEHWRRARKIVASLLAPLRTLGRTLVGGGRYVPAPGWLPSPRSQGVRGLIYSAQAFALVLGVILLTGGDAMTTLAADPGQVLWSVLLPVAVLLGAQTWWQRRHSDSDPRRWVLLAPVAIVAMWWAAIVVPWYDLVRSVGGGIIVLVQLVIVVGLVGAGIAAFLRLRDTTPSVEKHRPDLLADPAIHRTVQGRSQPGGVLAGEVGGQPLHIGTQDRACVIGPPGTGKTAFLVAQLLDWAESGRSFVVNDIKPEILEIVRERLEAKGYRLLAFNPTAQSGEGYNPLDDLESPEAVGELASALVPPTDDAEQSVFIESARDLLDALICHLRDAAGGASLPSLRDYVAQFSDHRELLRELAASPSPDARDLANGLRIMANNERLMGSIFATFQSNLRFLRFPAIREALAASDFTLADLCRGRVGLFLQFEESQQQTTARLFSVMMGHVLRYLIEHTNRAPVLLLLDEIGNVPQVAGLVQKLNTIRSRELPTWLYWQSREQMQPYGTKNDEGPNIIMGACDLHLVFRLNDNGTAQWVSDKIGSVDRLIEAVSASEDPGFLSSEYTYTHSQSLEREPIIWPHQLQQLAQGEAVCTYQGLAWRGTATPYYRRWPEFERR